MSQTNYGSLYSTIEGENENENNENEREEKKKISTGFITFLLLFLLSAGLLVYYQFYQGKGHWHFTLVHKANDASFISLINADSKKVEFDAAALKKENDSLKNSLANAARNPENLAG